MKGSIIYTDTSYGINHSVRLKTNLILNHFWWWLFFITYELSQVYLTSTDYGKIYTYLPYYAVNILLFYNHLRVLDKTAHLSEWRIAKLILLVLLEIVVYLLIKISMDYVFLSAGPEAFYRILRKLAAMDFYRCVFFASLATLYWTASHISGFERQTKEAEIKQLKITRDALALEGRLAKSENALLRQQINPHLLFNSLNFIHSTVYKVSEEAAETVIMLSDLLRFSLKEAGEDGKILLKEEIDQIDNLVAINRIRFKNTANINFNISGDPSCYRIIPLVLITLVENIFKHGNFIDQGVVISLELADDGFLRFYTCNKLKAKAPYPRLKSTGLQNIRVRLDYAYGDAYDFTTRERDEIFESELNLQL